MIKSFRPRVWMGLAAIAVLAAAIEWSGLGPRWRGYRRGAGDCAVTAASCRNLMRECLDDASRLRKRAEGAAPEEASRLGQNAAGLEARADEWRQLAEWNERSAAIYREATARPWRTAARVPPFVLRPGRPGSPR